MPDDIQGAVPTIHKSSEQLRLFAFEAEVNEDFDMAAVYYEEVNIFPVVVFTVICTIWA